MSVARGNIVATGEGVPCHGENLERLKALGTVVWLKAELATLYNRATRSGMRPVLANRRREEVEALYREREPYYARAHLTIETDGLGPDEVEIGRASCRERVYVLV